VTTLGIRNELNEELPISSSEESFCLCCGVAITKDNDSGWERFRADGVTTQKICKSCDSEKQSTKKAV